MRLIFLGCGYLGFNLSEQLKQDFDVALWGIDSPYVPFSSCFHEVDVFDEKSIRKMDCRDAIVIDTVSLVGNDAFSDREEELLSDLKQKYECLLRILKEGGMKRFVFFSSGGTVYGNTEEPVDESAAVHPLNLYARSKVMLEEVIRANVQDALILRVANPYGGYQLAGKRQGVVPVLIRSALRKEAFHMWIAGNSVRDYFYIDDLALALKLLIEHDVGRETINVGSGIPVQLSEVIREVESCTGRDIAIIHETSQVTLVNSIILNIGKLQKLTGFEPSVSLPEGIARETKRILEEEGI